MSGVQMTATVYVSVLKTVVLTIKTQPFMISHPDWLMVALNTIDRSQLTPVHSNDQRNQ